jgi:hypothetical protein
MSIIYDLHASRPSFSGAFAELACDQRIDHQIKIAPVDLWLIPGSHRMLPVR